MADKTTTTDKPKNGATTPTPLALPTDTRFQIAADVFAKMLRDLSSDEEVNARHAFKAADAFIRQYHASK